MSICKSIGCPNTATTGEKHCGPCQVIHKLQLEDLDDAFEALEVSESAYRELFGEIPPITERKF